MGRGSREEITEVSVDNLQRRPKPQVQPRNAQTAESNGCVAHASSSMAVGVPAAISHVDSNNSSSSHTQQPMEKGGAPGTEQELHVNGPSVIRLPDEEFRRMKRTPSAIGIAQVKTGVVLESGANGGSGTQSPLAAMNKRRKMSHEGNPDMK